MICSGYFSKLIILLIDSDKYIYFLWNFFSYDKLLKSWSKAKVKFLSWC